MNSVGRLSSPPARYTPRLKKEEQGSADTPPYLKLDWDDSCIEIDVYPQFTNRCVRLTHSSTDPTDAQHS